MTKEVKTKKVTVTMTASQQEQAREISKDLIGKENVSGLFVYWINKYNKEKEGAK
jgi:hypothetical protein